MESEISLRKAIEKDLPVILNLYGQPEIDDGKLLSLQEAENIFSRMQSYPDYSPYVAEYAGRVVGTFALLIMDNSATSVPLPPLSKIWQFLRRCKGTELVRKCLATQLKKPVKLDVTNSCFQPTSKEKMLIYSTRSWVSPNMATATCSNCNTANHYIPSIDSSRLVWLQKAG